MTNAFNKSQRLGDRYLKDRVSKSIFDITKYAKF